MKQNEDTWKNIMPKKNKKRSLAKGFPIVKKIFKDLLREKSILFAITLQIFIILTTSIMLTNSVNIFSTENMLEQETKLGITGDLDISERLSKYFENSKLEYSIFDDKDDAMRLFESRDLDAIIDIKRDIDLFPIYIDMYVPKGDVKTSIILSEIRKIYELMENELREENLAEPDAIMLKDIRITLESNSVATQIFETLYRILIPFLLLMPGVLLGGMIIDILMEELEKKTLNILMLVVSFKRYIFELIIATLIIASIQIITWQILILIQGIEIANLPQITLLTMILNFILFTFCVIITLSVMDKTKAQVIYSFIILLLFASMPLFFVNPIRVISRLAIGIVSFQIIPYIVAMLIISGILFSGMILAIQGKEW